MDLGPVLRAMGRNKARASLIVFEIALTLAIVTNCVAMIAEARGKMMQPSGFDDDDIVFVRSMPFEPAFREDGYLDNAVRADLETLRGVPGVVAATNTRFLPWQGGGSSTTLRPAGATTEPLRTQIYGADHGTFDALGVQVTEGRNFTREDVERDTLRLRALGTQARARGEDGQPSEKFLQEVVITRAFGKLAFGEGPLLGKRLEDSDGDHYQVVGVIDAFYNPYGWPIHEYAVFYPSWSRSYDFGAPYLVRVEDGRAEEVAATLEKTLLGTNPGRELRIRTLSEIKAQYHSGSQLVVTLMTLVAVLLVLVTSLGIVGLTSFSVTERTRQIGTRRALGARRVDVLRHFLLENWLMTTFGLVLGVALAFGLNVALVNQAGATHMNPGLVAAGVVLLWAAGALATLAPALRATRISPAIATRNV